MRVSPPLTSSLSTVRNESTPSHGETDRRVCLGADDRCGNSRCFFSHTVLILL